MYFVHVCIIQYVVIGLMFTYMWCIRKIWWHHDAFKLNLAHKCVNDVMRLWSSNAFVSSTSYKDLHKAWIISEEVTKNGDRSSASWAANIWLERWDSCRDKGILLSNLPHAQLPIWKWNISLNVILVQIITVWKAKVQFHYIYINIIRPHR